MNKPVPSSARNGESPMPPASPRAEGMGTAAATPQEAVAPRCDDRRQEPALRACNIRELVRDIPFPTRRGFENHAYAYNMLKMKWKNFRGPVKNMEHFILAQEVKELSNKKVWHLCVECCARRTRLLWLDETGLKGPKVQELML